MNLNISQLKAKWEKEKTHYQKQEIGSGVQKFVKDVLKSEEIFGLTECLKSTPKEQRENEFLEEEKTKGQNKADIIIFISPEIVIPVEIERYQNITAGEKQLLDYQTHLDKQYGILTDGYSWRFYNNNIYRKFDQDKIFEETEIFLEFWREYIKPESYYLGFFEPKGQRFLFKEEDQLKVKENLQMFFVDITERIKSFNRKLDVEGYFKEFKKKEKEKKAVEITYAYIIQFILYKTLVDNAFSKFGEEFERNVKAIHEHLKNKNYGAILGIIDGISADISEKIYRPFAKEQELIRQKLLEIWHSPKNVLSDVSPWLDIFTFIKKYDFANIQNEIFGYIYENYLKELYEEKQKGQYFTDPDVVNFMLQQIGFSKKELQKRYQFDKNSVSLIDPACGSGTFLYRAVDIIHNAFGNNSEKKSKQIEDVVTNNIFGLDIAEFPLYLAEMNILMRMLPLIINEKYNNPVDKKIKVFLTKDSVSEFLSKQSLLNLYQDIGYESYVREEGDLKEMKESLRSNGGIPRRRFDYVIGNPPYVGYNECSKQKIPIFELMKQGKVRLNNIYDLNLHSIPDISKKRPPKPNLYAFFIALGIALLKDSGKLCYIIPQTLLTSSDHDTLRYYLAGFTTIERIITFGGKMFIGRGLKQNKPIPTSSLIFVINREKPSTVHQVEIINYKNPDDSIEETLRNILNNKKVSKKKIMQGKLLNNVTNWNFIKQNKIFLDLYEEYTGKTNDISIYYEHVLAKRQFKVKFYFDIGYKINEKEILDEPEIKSFIYPRLNKNYWTIKEFRGYWPDIREGCSKFTIGLLQANQGYNLLDSKYKVLWSYANPRRFHFASMPVIWARNQICAIGSENKEEILYLFALLNSPIITTVLFSNLKNENEKDVLISATAVKEFVRIPKITKDNDFIKKEIIKTVEEMLSLEEKTLTNFVDFSNIMIQKFDNIKVGTNEIILFHNGKEMVIGIRDEKKLITKIIKEKFGSEELKFEKKEIGLQELKNLPVIDFEKQGGLKDYIDDLVFALYFNVPLKKASFEKANEIKRKCKKNKFYGLLNDKENGGN